MGDAIKSASTNLEHFDALVDQVISYHIIDEHAKVVYFVLML